MLGAIGRDKGQIVEAQKALNEHAQSLNSALKTLESLPLSSESKASIGDAEQPRGHRAKRQD